MSLDDILFSKDWRKYLLVDPFVKNTSEYEAFIPDPTMLYFDKLAQTYSMENGMSLKSVKEDKELWSKSIAVIDIGYDNLAVKKTVESVADQVSSLISDLGGQFGLWLGISMVSVLEVIYCAGYYCHKLRKCSLLNK